jgi:hypothetical protein
MASAILHGINANVQALVRLSGKITGATRDVDVANALEVQQGDGLVVWDLVEQKFLLPLANLSDAIEAANALLPTEPPLDSKSGPESKLRAPPGLLSLRDYAATQAAIELVVCWGVYPLLDVGLGTSLASRPLPKTFKGTFVGKETLAHYLC